MDRHIFVVLTNPVEGGDAEFNDWYTNVHLRDVLSVPGFVAAQRFRLADEQMFEPGPYRYLALYEIETDDVAATLTALRRAAGSMEISAAMDRESAAWVFSALTERRTADDV